MTIGELLQLAGQDENAFAALHLGYTETFGAPDLRESIANTYSVVNADQVLTFAGAEEGIFVAMQVLLTARDHAIVITPNYQAAETIPGSICAVTGIALNAEQNWSLDLDELRTALRANTKLISINFPHNPTGKVLERAAFDELVEIARERGIYLFSDEVYRLLERTRDIRLPAVADVYERGLSLNVMSKTYGLPGLRIGWIATQDSDLLSKMEHAKHYLSICNSGPSEFLATTALSCRDKIIRRNHSIIDGNLTLLNEFFARRTDLFDWNVPDGGCIGYPRYKGADGVENFCQNLVENAGVFLLPASIYRSELTTTPNDRFRIGFGRFGLQESLDALQNHIS